jgi:DNA-binding NarL/FixJ family response regulator
MTASRRATPVGTELPFRLRPLSTPTVSTALVSAPHAVIAHGLAAMLRVLPSVADVGFAADATPEDLAHAGLAVCHVGTGPGDEATRFVRLAAAAGVPVLAVLPAADLDRAVVLAAALGADGYLLDVDLTVPALADALAKLAAGAVPMSPALVRRMMSRIRTGAPAPPRRPALTPRETQTLTLLAEGLSNKQIARRLDITLHGVKRHVASVLVKLDSPNRTLAVATALRDGLLTGPSATGPATTCGHDGAERA